MQVFKRDSCFSHLQYKYFPQMKTVASIFISQIILFQVRSEGKLTTKKQIRKLAGVITLLCNANSYFCICVLSGSAAKMEIRFDCTAGIKNFIRAHPSDIRVRKPR